MIEEGGRLLQEREEAPDERLNVSPSLEG